MSRKVYRARFEKHPELYARVFQLKKNSFVVAGTPYADQATVGYGSFWHYVELETGVRLRRQEVADYRRITGMTKRMDTYRIANAFQQAAVSCHYEQCSNIIKNFAHVYREEYQAVLSMVSVMLMDPAGFTAEEYKLIKEAIRKAGNKRD